MQIGITIFITRHYECGGVLVLPTCVRILQWYVGSIRLKKHITSDVMLWLALKHSSTSFSTCKLTTLTTACNIDLIKNYFHKDWDALKEMMA